MILRISGLMVALALIVSPTPARGDAAAEAKALVTEGWSVDGLNAAERRYELIASGAASDANVDYAMALVRLKFRKYQEALTALESATTRQPAHLAAWRAKCWLLVYMRQHDDAVAQMQAVANIFPADEKAEPIEADLCETARWLGRLHGHLTWGGAAKLPMDQHTKALLTKLSGARLAAFEEGREEVRVAFEELQAQRKTIEEQDAEDEAKRRELAVESNKKERERIAAERAELEQQAESAKAKADADLSEVNAKLAPFETAFAELERQAGPILNRLRDFRRRAEQRDGDARRERDAGRRRELERDADRLRDEARREERNLDPISRDAERVKREGAALQAERAKIVAGYQATVTALNQKLAALAKDEKAVEKSEKALEQPPGASPRQTSLNAKIAALSTYQKFPLEEERTRVMK